jgi:hypothetical protein
MNFLIATQKVEKGLAWLKESGPAHGFDYTRIDPRTVHVMDPIYCPLAQAGGTSYGGALRRIFTSPGQRSRFIYLGDWSQEHGFDVSNEHGWQQEDVFLSHAWQQALRADDADLLTITTEDGRLLYGVLRAAA